MARRKKKRMQLINVYIKPDQKEKLEDLADKKDVSIAHLIREGIDYIISKYQLNNQEKKSSK